VQLVNQAGGALGEITKSITTVTEIIADIASASTEQSSGIDEVNKALTMMDAVTQQNSALVEENAATAKALEVQAQNMDDQVGFFRIESADAAGGKPVPGRRAADDRSNGRAQPARPRAA
jgi:methyl-accepting chemotaxis protein